MFQQITTIFTITGIIFTYGISKLIYKKPSQSENTYEEIEITEYEKYTDLWSDID